LLTPTGSNRTILTSTGRRLDMGERPLPGPADLSRRRTRAARRTQRKEQNKKPQIRALVSKQFPLFHPLLTNLLTRFSFIITFSLFTKCARARVQKPPSKGGGVRRGGGGCRSGGRQIATPPQYPASNNKYKLGPVSESQLTTSLERQIWAPFDRRSGSSAIAQTPH
jgi:hypothetical protein